MSACGGGDEPVKPQPDSDPLLDGALAEQIMVDPDLVGQNQAANVASVSAPDGSIPALDMDVDTISAARQEAIELVGGTGAMRKAPEPKEVSGALPESAALTAAARAAAAPGGNRNCAEDVNYTAKWAARLPAAFPVYPRSAVQEAAGTDGNGCALRVVNFQTPVDIDDVTSFYYTRATAAGYSAQHVREGGDNVLGGVKGRASYVIYARTLPTGATEVDMVVSGG
ncbi:hypothetical protein [Paraurantiacibacter namhicola]|uniref:hypothetical protein n=1 Tax=Paraurantiacibacter namhicola TaxID=645517 RepID=UPI001F1F93E9|nr:hypothetical protein [Paraurantiacibacter namhicola]